MSRLRRIVLVRHGETVGNSSVRFHGSGDVPLSDAGRAQLRETARALRTEAFDLVVASPLRRSWEGAAIVSGGASVRLEPDFREIHFGRWEGLTAEEIEAAEPALYRDWQSRVEGFEFPEGERRAAFRERVLAGLDRLLESEARSCLVVAHKGVIRTIVEKLCGEAPEQPHPELGEVIQVTRGADGAWFRGPRSSDPVALRS